MSSTTKTDQFPLYPRKDGESGLYGFWSSSGWVIEPQFKHAQSFNQGFAAIELIDKTPAFCDLKGRIIPIKSLCGGRKLAKETFSSSGFSEDEGSANFAPVRISGWWKKRWGVLDTSLNFRPLPDRIFAGAKTVRIFGNYAVPVFAGRDPGDARVGFFNLIEHRLELPIDYSWVYPSDGTIWVVARRSNFPRGSGSSENRHCFYDLKQKSFLPGNYWTAHPFSSNIGSIGSETGPAYFVDENLNPVFDRQFDVVDPFRFGLAAFFKENECGYLDTTGQTRLLLSHYSDLKCFNRLGHAFANRNSQDWNFDIIDRQGRALVSGIDAIFFSDGNFPHYEVTHDEEEWLYDESLTRQFLIRPKG